MPPFSKSAFSFLLLAIVSVFAIPGKLVSAERPPNGISWQSAATGEAIAVTLLEPTTPARKRPLPLVIYLTRLAAPRVGTDSDADIIADLRGDGYLVAVFDYHQHARSRWPHLNQDLANLRAQLHRRKFLADRRIDPAQIFIVPSGHRLLRHVPFFKDGTRLLAMDIIYPSRPAKPVGAMLEFSCDNENRMGNYSLQYCSDTLLEGAATEGFAVAMADHPVAAPYEGIDALPEAAAKVKSAVRALRGTGQRLGLNDKIVTLGFSRGSGMALLAATTMGFDPPDMSEHGVGVPDVSGAIVLSGRFTYLDLLPDDRMIPRYKKAWGPQSEGNWKFRGALDWLQRPAVPLFLSINITESPDALHQMEVLRKRLTAMNSPFQYHPETQPRGHKMPLAPDVLEPMLKYLRERLSEK